MNVLPKNNLIGGLNSDSDSDDFGTVPFLFFYHIFCSWRRKERNPEERSFVFKSESFQCFSKISSGREAYFLRSSLGNRLSKLLKLFARQKVIPKI